MRLGFRAFFSVGSYINIWGYQWDFPVDVRFNFAKTFVVQKGCGLANDVPLR